MKSKVTALHSSGKTQDIMGLTVNVTDHTQINTK